MYRMRRKIERDNRVIPTVLYEFEFNIDIESVRNQHSIYILKEDLNGFIKMTNSLIIDLSI